MAVWYILLLSVILGALANEHSPNNPPYLLEEVKATAESRVLERVEHLLQTLSAKIKVLDDGNEEIKRNISSLFLAQNETSKSLGNVSAQLQTFSMSTTQRMSNLDHKLERIPVNTLTESVNEMKRDIGSLSLAQNEASKALGNVSAQLQSFSISTTQRMASLGHNFDRIPELTGVYFMQPDPSEKASFEVSRDWTNNHGFGSNWIVFQRRINGSVNFYRNWTEYQEGFGDLRGEHWLGLDKLHAILKTRQHELLIVLEDFDGVIAYAHYDDFKIGDESEKYLIKSVGKYTGTAGDSFTRHKGELFSTYDQDNDKNSEHNCAQFFKGAWWFEKCYFSHLNGPYLKGKLDNVGGIAWYHWRGNKYSLKSSKMMVRPVA